MVRERRPEADGEVAGSSSSGLPDGSDRLGALREHLGQAIRKCDSAEIALRAAIALDPATAASWLCENGDELRNTCRGTRLSALVSECVLAAARSGGSAAKPSLRALAQRFSDCLEPDAAVAVARSAGGDADVELRRLLDQVLERHPRDVALLRSAADLAEKAGDAPRAHELLTRLARADAGQATVHRVYRKREKLPPAGDPPLRMALLSSYTVDALVPFVDLELRCLGLRPEFYVAPFNSWAREVIDPDSALRRFAPELAVLAVSIDDLVPQLAGSPSAAELDQAGQAALEQVLGVARRFSEWCESPLVVHGFHSAHRGPLGILEGRSGRARTRWLNDLNAQLAEALAQLPRAYFLDMQELLVHRPGGAADNPKLRHLAGMRLADGVCGEVARAYARYAAPLKGLTRKCVVVDLDGTLWGGTVGEDGRHGIKLGNTSPGSEFQEFQRYLLSLTRAGFLLAICSKNNPEDALEVIRGHEGMILREDVFSAARINWDPKPENLVEIARELDIGLDSMIFLDDNPNERERVRQFLPQVLVPELPADPSLFRRTLESLPEIQTLVTTDEDRNRVDLYRAKRQREAQRGAAQSVEEYLESLAIEVEIAAADETSLSRVHQLFQRTNQFNLTTRRYDLQQLKAFAEDERTRLYTLRARDRFGDHGLVAVALAREGADEWMVDSFLMSCRVIGYGVESVLLAVLSEDARAAGASSLVGEFRESAKNAPARDFFPRHGFSQLESEGDELRFRSDLRDGCVPRPAWIEVRTERAA